MKQSVRTVLAACLCLLALTPVAGQWTGITNFPLATDGAVSMVINGKAYLNAGLAGNEFYSYDPADGNWVRLADVPSSGDVLAWAFSFVVNGKGYVAGGSYETASDLEKTLWEYDPASDSWTQKADFPGGQRDGGYSFAIGNKGYIGGGFDGQYLHNDLYEYDPATDQWAMKANFPGGPVIFPASFVIGDKAYVGTGDQSGTEILQFWEYDPASDAWTRKADFAGEKRQTAIGFSIDGKGYFGGGMSAYSINRKDFWEYDPMQDQWSLVDDAALPTEHTAWSTGFAIGNTAYFGLGVKFPEFTYSNQFLQMSFSLGSAVLSDYANQGIRIYPNPATESVNVSSEEEPILRIRLYDAGGRELYAGEGTVTRIDLSGMTPGIYLLQVETGQGIIRKPLILTH